MSLEIEQHTQQDELFEALEALFLKQPDMFESYKTHCLVLRDIHQGPIAEKHREGRSYIENLALKNSQEKSP